MKKVLIICLLAVLLTGCLGIGQSPEARQRETFIEYLEKNGYPADEDQLYMMKTIISTKYTDLFRELLVDNHTGVSLEAFMICSRMQMDPETMKARYDNLGAEGFNVLPFWQSYDGKTDQLAMTEGAQIGEFARYLWYMEKHGVDAATAVHDVNLGMDIPEEPTDYTALTEDNTRYAQEVVLQQLVNKNVEAKELLSWYGWFSRDVKHPDEQYGDADALVEVSILDEFMRMADDLHAAIGKTIKIKNGYISREQQAEIYEKAVKEHGEEYAQKYVPQPGHSDHQTLVALDIYEEGTPMEQFEQTESYRWLMEHGHEYCFWLRYPDYKEYITGYPFTPWHFHFYTGESGNEAYCLQKFHMTYEELWYMTFGFNLDN